MLQERTTKLSKRRSISALTPRLSRTDGDALLRSESFDSLPDSRSCHSVVDLEQPSVSDGTFCFAIPSSPTRNPKALESSHGPMPNELLSILGTGHYQAQLTSRDDANKVDYSKFARRSQRKSFSANHGQEVENVSYPGGADRRRPPSLIATPSTDSLVIATSSTERTVSAPGRTPSQMLQTLASSRIVRQTSPGTFVKESFYLPSLESPSFRREIKTHISRSSSCNSMVRTQNVLWVCLI